MPGTPKSIFAKERLRPAQLRTVANRRWDDAEFLRRSGRNKHANGAMYLGGFVIECLLKAELLREHPWLQSARNPAELGDQERELWSCCYRSHELDEILTKLPRLQSRLDIAQTKVIDALKRVCSEWTIYARYSPRTATLGEAALFLNRVGEVKSWLS